MKGFRVIMRKIKYIFILLILIILFYGCNNNKLYRKRTVSASITNTVGEKKKFTTLI